MKSLKTTFVFILLSVCYLHSSAQNNPPVNEPDYNKPKLFADLPDRISFDISTIDNLMNLRVGSATRILPTTDLLFVGNVISTYSPQNGSVKTIVIKLTNRPGATFTLTKITNKDGSIIYKGRIISRSNGDAFEITKERDQYFLIKKNLYDLMNE